MYGIWLKWPGIWVTDGKGSPRSWPNEQAAQDWAEAEDFDPESIEIRPL